MSKKKLYLRDENYNWKQFEYESIEDLKSEFNSRNISIGNRASIGDEVKLLTGLFINGSKHTVTYAGNGMLSIGCHTHSIDEWIANAESIGDDEDYTTEQINEYKGYIQIAKVFHDSIKP